LATVRLYAEDRDACLAIFDTNVPKFFAPSEREQFAAFLDVLPGPYFVAEHEAEVIGCAGFARNGDGSASLCWGMVRRAWHGRGVGTLLLERRLEAIREDHTIESVIMNTSQHTVAFFQKFGFQIERVIPDGYAPGLDRYELRLPLNSAPAVGTTQTQAVKSNG
jgi:ribosomal protein S18 acetylase RimI-like enzyme